jgi:MerC mercury resistance protein
MACAIHCALLPLFINALPLLGINLINNIYFEAGMIITAFIIGSATLWHGYKKHHHRLFPLFSFLIGMSLLVFNHFVDDYKLWLIIPSSLLIISAYYFNWRLCRLAKHCHNTDCNH